MMRLVAVLIVFSIAGSVPAGGDKAAKKELKKLEGTWVLVSGEKNGKELPEEILKNSKLVIAGNKHIVNIGDERFVGTHELDPSEKPKTIDAVDGPDKIKKMFGIYEVKGDQFKVCFAEPGKDRPTEFTGKEGSGCFIHVWKRTKGIKGK
jgi:uncharacterized protein (TIGR03067 family)